MPRTFKVSVRRRLGDDEQLKCTLYVISDNETAARESAQSRFRQTIKELAATDDFIVDRIKCRQRNARGRRTPAAGSLEPAAPYRKNHQEHSMTAHDYERVVARYDDLPEPVRLAFDPHIADAQIVEIVTARAHGVVETAITYLRDGKLHEVIYDETTAKILGGTESKVIENVIEGLSEKGKREVLERGKSIRKIKIKHDEMDDREYLHVHYIDDAGNISNCKLELDGSVKQKAA